MKKTTYRICLTLVVCFLTLSITPAYALELKVMSWNVEDMDIFDGQGAMRVPEQVLKEKAIAAVIRRVSPDILFIIESPSFIHLRYFVKANQLPYQVAHVRQLKGNRSYADGMALLVRNDRSMDAVTLETPAVPESNRPPATRHLDWSMRGLLVSKVEGVNVIGVHLKSPGGENKEKALKTRLKQAKGLLSYVKNLDGPAIIAGDFNDGPGIGPLESEHEVDDTMAVFEEGELKRAAGTDKTHEKGFNIDHILVKGGQIGERTVEPTAWTLSDHRPVWCTVTTE